MCQTCVKPRYQIRFESIGEPGRAICFPCDAKGHVALDELSDAARREYLFARAVVGREYAPPSVRRIECN